jgi:predicted nucleotidyltransferase
MYLERILGSKTKINVLAVLVTNPGKSYVEKDLARECGASLSEVNRQMPDLVNSGLVTMQRMAKVKVYRINRGYFLFGPLEGLFRDLGSVYMEMADKIMRFITEKHKMHAVMLLGSLAENSIREDIVEEPSDIDLVFIAEKKKEVEKDLISFINSEISKEYGVVVYPIVLTEKEYLKGLKDDRLVIEVHSKGEVIYGKKPRRFG